MKFSEHEIEQAMKQAAANLAIEGLETTEEQDELIRKKLRGEISHDEFIQEALRLAKR